MENRKTVLVTGATGAVGSALVRELIAHECEIYVFSRPNSGRLNAIPVHPRVHRVDCALEQLSQLSLPDVSADTFYHLAWEGTTGAARNDVNIQNRNIKYALDAVSAARRFGCRKFIGVGSQAEYGRVSGILKPSTPTFPETAYGMAKLCAGQMTGLLAHQLGMAYNWVRILSVYGPNDGAQSMVMTAIRKFRDGETALFTKAEQQWDYLYSGDAARALYLIGECGADGKTYVLGSGHVRPLADYIRMIRDAVDSRAPYVLGALPYAENQVMYLQADLRELSDDTGFLPLTDFADGIRQTVRSCDDRKRIET